jgi:AcrR family transcriptional regulator
VDRRERQRAATSAEIRDVARRQLAVTGAAGLSLRAVAREMGLTAPALYRYYDDRDALLTALIVDAYRSVVHRMEQARDALDPDDLAGRIRAAAGAFRDWAVASPHEFALVFGSPVPGYTAPQDGPTREAGQRFGQVFQELFTQQWQRAPWPLPPAGDRTPELDAVLAVAGAECGGPLPPGAMQMFLSCWARLHGLISLEVFGHLAWIGPHDGDALFRAELTDMLNLIVR